MTALTWPIWTLASITINLCQPRLTELTSYRGEGKGAGAKRSFCLQISTHLRSTHVAIAELSNLIAVWIYMCWQCVPSKVNQAFLRLFINDINKCWLSFDHNKVTNFMIKRLCLAEFHAVWQQLLIKITMACQNLILMVASCSAVEASLGPQKSFHFFMHELIFQQSGKHVQCKRAHKELLICKRYKTRISNIEIVKLVHFAVKEDKFNNCTLVLHFNTVSPLHWLN